MSEQLDRRARDFSKFDSMTTEALQQILRLDAMKPEGEESDTEELFYIMEVLADRRRNDSTYTGKTAQQAFEDFQKYYMPEDAVEETSSEAPERKSKPSVLWLRRLGTLAAALAIVFFTTMTADAFGFDPFGKVAKWSAEFFHFDSHIDATEASNPDPHFEINDTSLQEALNKYGISHNLIPKWLPESYILLETTITASPQENAFYSVYKSDKSTEVLTISIRQILNDAPLNIEKNDELVEIYTINGISYFIFKNTNMFHICWVFENFECLITCNLPIDIVKAIINSI